ncbi:hypothetical protein BCV69DRAFT_94651 [Microstroma glucosiphilum]|uniref:Uncharacterized protein n=1 Tax=Pseudomicrostroma glucosiphilum TaxID=1684307 RepID=A0A316UBZ8_9BASI|nr:hypothetical protein BCV69DRAFT_94651 [Pseudomicrostroma glucosiphilum]PWN22699.1 hypothetical protein BCV69DRAFT_94651 [Pseudomicrostroma glucosiphilum]
MSYDRHQYPPPHDDHGPPLQQSSSTLSGALDIHREQSHGDSVHAQLSSPSKEHDQRRAHELPTTAEQWFLPSPPEAPSSQGRSSLAHALQWPSTPARPAVPPTCSTPVKRTSEMQWEPDSAFEVNATPSWTAVQDTSPTASPFPFTFVSNPVSRREGWAEQRAAGTSQQYQPTKLGGPAMGFNAAQWGSAGIDHSRYATWPAGSRPTAVSDDDLHHHKGTDGIGSGLGEGLDLSPSVPILSRHDNSQGTSPLGGKRTNSYDMPPDRDAGPLTFDWASAPAPSADSQHPSALYPALPSLTQGLQTLGLTLDQLTTLGPADDTHNDSQLSINTSADSMLSSPDFDNSWETSLSAEQSSMESSFASSRTPPQMKGWCDPSVSLSLAPPRGGHILEDATPRSFPVASGYVPPAALPVNLEANQHVAADNGLPPRSSSPRPFASASQAAPLDLMDERLPWGPPPSPSSSSGCDFADPHSQAPSSAQPEPSQLAELLGSDAMIQIQAKLGFGPPSIRAGPAQSATAAPSHVAHQAGSTAQARMRQAQDKIGTEEVLVALKNLRMFLQGTDDQQHLRSVIELESSIIQSRDVQISGSSADPPPPSEATKSATMVAPCPPRV